MKIHLALLLFAVVMVPAFAQSAQKVAKPAIPVASKALPVIDWGVSEEDLSIQLGSTILGKAMKTHTLEQIQKSAELGDKLAQYLLAVAHEMGNGVAKDDAKKVAWLIKASDQGVLRARANLGVSYIRGTGTDVDDIIGWTFLLSSAKAGNATAQYNAAMFTLVGIDQGNGMTKQYAYLSKKIAYEMLMSSAQAGFAPAEYSIGNSYIGGTEFNKKDKAQARLWLNRAAAHGSHEAAALLLTL